MKKVWSVMGKTEDNRYREIEFCTTEPEKWFRCFSVEDPEEFIAHMYRYQELTQKILSREDYEKICVELNVEPESDKSLKQCGITFGVFAKGNHNTPESRQQSIASKLHEARYKGIKQNEQAAH